MDKKRLIIISIFIAIFLIAIILSVNYYNGKYSVYFETGTNDVFLTKYVEKNGKVTKPSNPEKEGYIFVEWQLDGKTFDFNTEINKNIVLTAKWMKEEYVTITFESDTEEQIKSKKILKGESIENLPIINKEGYDFAGWMFNGQLYNGEEIFDDITLVAQYVSVGLKIGDKVKIVGKYSNSAYNLSAKYYKAIGWYREVLDIFPDSEFPYMVGNNTGVTGFFKDESIEIVKGE